MERGREKAVLTHEAYGRNVRCSKELFSSHLSCGHFPVSSQEPSLWPWPPLTWEGTPRGLRRGLGSPGFRVRPSFLPWDTQQPLHASPSSPSPSCQSLVEAPVLGGGGARSPFMEAEAVLWLLSCFTGRLPPPYLKTVFYLLFPEYLSIMCLLLTTLKISKALNRK